MRNQLAKLALREAMREPDLPLPNEAPSMEDDECVCPKCKYVGPKDDFMLEAELDDPEPEDPDAEEDY
jgi:hypothetical protein